MDPKRIARLTEQQRACLRHVYAHLTSKQIAERYGVNASTINHIFVISVINNIAENVIHDNVIANNVIIDKVRIHINEDIIKCNVLNPYTMGWISVN